MVPIGITVARTIVVVFDESEPDELVFEGALQVTPSDAYPAGHATQLLLESSEKPELQVVQAVALAQTLQLLVQLVQFLAGLAKVPSYH